MKPWSSTSGLVRPHLESTGQVWSPEHLKTMDLLEPAQRRLQKWPEVCSTFPIRRGWESWDCSTWRREDFRVTSQQPSPANLLERVAAAGQEVVFLKQNRLDSGGIEDWTFLARSMVKYCGRLLRDVVDASSLETFEVRLDRSEQPCLLHQDWTNWPLRDPSKPN